MRKGRLKAEPRVREGGEAGTLCRADFFISRTWSHARTFQRTILETSGAHQSLPPQHPLPLFSLSQLKKKAHNIIFFHIRKHSFPLESRSAEMVSLF